MNKKNIHLFTGLVIIALSLFYAFRGVKIEELGNALLQARYIYLVPAVALVVFSYLLRAMRWQYLIRSIKVVKTVRLFSPLMVGFMANMLPARAGEFVRAYLLSRKEQISFSSSFATIFIERLFDLIIVLIMLVSVLLFIPEVFISGDAGGDGLLEKVKLFGMVSFLLCLFIFIFSVLLQFKKDLAMKVIGFFVRPFSHKWREKIFGMVESFSDGLQIIRDRRGFIASVFLSFLIWGIFIFTYYPLYLAFDIAHELPLASSLVVLCLTVAIFITVAPTPGFLGSYHLGCVAALHGIFGVQKAVALSFGIVAWLVAMGTTVFIGAIFAIKENISIGSISAGQETVE
ncbi:MAG: lysylphosphatidylglycerol synthase transmembrane domain-containing protein [Nitrospirota bacterium]